MFKRPDTDRKPDEEPLKISYLNDISEPQGDTRTRTKSHRSKGDPDPQFAKKSKAEKPVADRSLPRSRGRAEGYAEKRNKYEKPMTATRIKNISEYYVSQREACSGMLRSMLHRRAYGWLKTLDDEERHSAEEQFKSDVEACIQKLQEMDFICDERYANMKARGWRADGKASRKIQFELSKKGISKEIIENAISQADEELLDKSDLDPDIAAVESDMASAENLARKKKIGPHRLKATPTDAKEKIKLWRREAGMLSRAGYNLEIIRQILDREPGEDDFESIL